MSWMRPLGRTGIEVSAIGLGTVKLGRNQGLRYPGEFALPNDRAAASLLDRARDLGVNLLDTAPAYGESEARLGQLLRGRRQDWVICSKAGEEFEDGHSSFDFSASAITRSVQRSLARLSTDYLDILLLHSEGNDLDLIDQGCLDTLADLRQQGLIRALGISTKTLDGGLAAAPLCDVLMLTYNLGYREEVPVLDACQHHATGVLLKKVLASGHLGEGPADIFLRQSMQLVMDHPGTSSALVGTLSPKHLAQTCYAARGALG